MLVRISISLLLSLLGFLSRAQESVPDTISKGVSIHVSIPKIESNKGKVYFSIYDSEKNFLLKIPFQKTVGTIVNHATEVTFRDIPEGTYAILCFHDRNDNHKLDFEGFRPVEDYGASNNPVMYGPPQFDLSRFTVADENLDLTITF